MIDVCLLGCGGMIPLPDRRLTALLCKYNGKMILIDCGEGTQIAIRLTRWGFKGIDAICFTHYHADHIAGLPGFLLTLGNSGRIEPLTIFGPPMLIEVIQGLTIICPELPFEINLVTLSNNNPAQNKIGDIIIKSLPVDHWIPCFAYSIEIERSGKFDIQKAKKLNIPMEFWNQLQNGSTVEHQGNIYKPSMILGEQRKGIKITYCTDTRPTSNLIDFCCNSDLLVCEGMYGSDEDLTKAISKKHMLFSEAARIAKSSNSKELWLTHFSPSLNDPDRFIDNARTIFSNSFVGNDSMTKTLNFE